MRSSVNSAAAGSVIGRSSSAWSVCRAVMARAFSAVAFSSDCWMTAFAPGVSLVAGRLVAGLAVTGSLSERPIAASAVYLFFFRIPSSQIVRTMLGRPSIDRT